MRQVGSLAGVWHYLCAYRVPLRSLASSRKPSDSLAFWSRPCHNPSLWVAWQSERSRTKPRLHHIQLSDLGQVSSLLWALTSCLGNAAYRSSLLLEVVRPPNAVTSGRCLAPRQVHCRCLKSDHCCRLSIHTGMHTRSHTLTYTHGHVDTHMPAHVRLFSVLGQGSY